MGYFVRVLEICGSQSNISLWATQQVSGPLVGLLLGGGGGKGNIEIGNVGGSSRSCSVMNNSKV
jgi:hypothetical protein